MIHDRDPFVLLGQINKALEGSVVVREWESSDDLLRAIDSEAPSLLGSRLDGDEEDAPSIGEWIRARRQDLNWAIVFGRVGTN